MLLKVLLSLPLSLAVGCSSMEDYMYPEPEIDLAAASVELGEGGVVLAYVEDSGALPVIVGSLGGEEARVLMATRRGRNSISPGRVPDSAQVEGELTLPQLVDGEVQAITLDVVRVEGLTLGEAQLGSLLMAVEELPRGVDLLVTARALPGVVITFDGPRRELRLRSGSLPTEREAERDTVRIELPMLWGEGASGSSRFMASIMSAVAMELDGPTLVGPSTSTVIDTQKGPELLTIGVGALELDNCGERSVRMDDIFGRDFDREQAKVVEELGSGWLVLGAQRLARHVLEIDATGRHARLSL